MNTVQKLKEQVAIYVRKSREGEHGAEEALYNQKETLTKLAESKGYQYDLFQEVESSINWHRPELVKMLEGVTSGKYKRILVTHTDRLSRDDRDSAELKEIFLKHEVLIETPLQVIDLTDGNQELMWGFTQVLSSFEYKRIKQRLTEGKFNNVANKNRWVGSRPPLGYDWNREIKKLTVNPLEKVIVRKMVELALQGYSSRLIAEQLNKLGYRGKFGSPFKTDRVLEVLKNRVYLGEVRINSKVLKKKAVAKNVHEPLMTDDEYNQIQSLFASRRVKQNLYALGTKSCVNKLMICGVCGKGLTIQKNDKGISKTTGKSTAFFQIRPCLHYLDEDRITKCHNRGIKIDKIEDAVKQTLLHYRGEIAEALKKLLNKDTSDIENNLKSNIEAIKQDINKREKQEKKLLQLYLDDVLDKQEYLNKKAELESIISALKDDLTFTERKLEQLDVSQQTNKLEKIMGLIDRFEEMPLEEQNATLKLIIDKIVFTKTQETNLEPVIDIHWREL
ncbi:recombinase family protein [Fictibacillus phosphorivorans]|uniref:recombinase family protein n=1 Tax=Fictibacillus phosphorivorans TaxID=1221500 RepID=UPI0035EFFFE2